MKEAGIDSPESQRGINFCVNSCPYDHCVVAEPLMDNRTKKRLVIKKAARELRRSGMTQEEISEALSVPRSTIERYLR